MKKTARIRFGRIIYFILAALFTFCVATQLFLAGAATFVSPVNWMHHITFVHLFGFNLPIFMLLFAFIGAMPKWAYWQLAGLFVLIFSMYFTANMTANLPWIGAIHPVLAALLLIFSCVMITKTFKFIFNKEEGEN
ncbi:DUF6220 domain-containing protein [Virgibacillus ndiopensis]|uniref:DUF6220 domain-containing protein n=1 Tax=Virgibacillus ndiopensis TaxID=2004408 RepID=UPI000C07ECAF|nr:DUF6220 domain-containing protein [Virgibacillus ndiopensis]